MFWQDLDPGYYQNPATYTYLVYALLRVMYGPLGFAFDLPFGNVTDQFDKNPTEIWIAARTLAAALCMGGVAATYWAARRLWGIREGLVAAALLAFAFLPVAYSRVAVTDVGALIGVALSMGFAVRAYERGALEWFLAGRRCRRARGLVQVHGRPRAPPARDRRARARARATAGGRSAASRSRRCSPRVVFVVLNPYLFTSFDAWWSDLRDQAEVARDQPKPGQESGGVSYYLDSLTWGLGWAAAIAALLGAVIELRRNLVRGLMLVAVPLALFVYLSVQSRYFGRWLLPAYPALAMLAAAAVGAGGGADRATAGAGGPPGPELAAAGGLTVLLLAQPLAADVRIGAGAGPRRHAPAGARLARGALPARAARLDRAGRAGAVVPLEPRGHAARAGSRAVQQRPGWTEPGWSYTAAGGGRVCAQYKPGLVARPDGGVRASAYQEVLDPGVIDDYRLYGYCLVVTVDTVRDRALQTGDQDARAYYDRLERESKVVRDLQPVRRGREAGPVQLRPLLQLLPARVQPARADRADPPARRLPPGHRPADRPHPARARAGAVRDLAAIRRRRAASGCGARRARTSCRAARTASRSRTPRTSARARATRCRPAAGRRCKSPPSSRAG